VRHRTVSLRREEDDCIGGLSEEGCRRATKGGNAYEWALCIEHLIRRYIMFRRILAALMLLGMLGTIAGCNTMRGFGEDVERGGEKIQEKSAR
jgi:entericidin B